jgi:pyruvate/2-oxoglutarate dehydrogenase complex dihydrolipoamide dehydrogenase (E3) component
VPWKDNASVMELRQIPRHLLVLGGGYIGCEMAQMFRRFGAAVTVVGTAPHLLPQEDEDVSTSLEEVFGNEGIELRLGTRPVAVEKGERSDGAGAEIRIKLAEGARLSGSHLLVATGGGPTPRTSAARRRGSNATSTVTSASTTTTAPASRACTRWATPSTGRSSPT